jgi:Meckelin (Transmembrane protein 67)
MHLNQSQIESYTSFFNSDGTFAGENVNIVLKVAVGAMVYLTFYLVQRLYNFLIYERFIDNCLQQFIDVSSIANISVLILLDSYGYYIHGRSG